ncbi:xanthine dehydrogenase molybdopterin binding subunit [Inquilinus sp. CAU 1745]|uniref:xanthine dehydrogenase molybdopterin binding subunit n=1 Tax=Inquilinus sp. CAU 1745 TaxID=3140369 RepID=UPI00325AF96E
MADDRLPAALLEEPPVRPLTGLVTRPLPHDSAIKHVTGEAIYTDDITESAGTLMAFIVTSEKARARIVGIEVEEARRMPGVHAVLTYEDVPGEVDIGPVFPGDPVLAVDKVEYVGQAVAVVAAETLEEARAAAGKVRILYEELPAILTAEEALEAGSFVSPSLTMRIGDSAAALARAPRRRQGTLTIGGQDHFYLEGQIAYALPGEDGDILCHSSTQHPSEVQHLIARVLGRPDHAVTVEVRRMGGGFGGKETQPALIACLASLLAACTGRPVKLRLDRDDDMVITGKRHDFFIRYDVGFDDEGRLCGIEMDLAARCGMSPDLSNAVVDRAMFHADNCYFLGDARITGHRCRTNTVSNTAFRGFGGPQGMVAIEHVLDEVARILGLDPLDVRRRNLYGTADRNLTHYHQRVEDNIAPDLIDRLEKSSDYQARRRAIDAFNAGSPVFKRGMALTPVKFGISFTVTHLNQAGALIHLYQDGSIQLNHGGTEMGQGVYIKVAQIVADAFSVPLESVRITATTTGKVPNTSPTAASSGTDLNGFAALDAARTIRNRLIDFLAGQFGCDPASVIFAGGKVTFDDREMPFAALAKLAYMHRVQLSATGFYKTPKIWWDRAKARGRPFLYYAYGAAVTEVAIDTLTGEYRLLRTDILHDCGRSVNPAIDRGQVEGGYVQGVGWLTTEELWWDEEGRLRTHAPSTYKIPTARDVPKDFRVELLTDAPNREDTVHKSKAVGEPPLMLAISAYLAIKDAVAAAADHKMVPHLDTPATPERVLAAVEEVRGRRP